MRRVILLTTILAGAFGMSVGLDDKPDALPERRRSGFQ